jgi:uncharacterized SAM-binding protein YcdF (DUF218 family)
VTLLGLFKELVSVLATPLVLAAVLALAAGVARALGRRRAGAILLACAAVVGYASAVEPVAYALIAPLEHRYAPLDDAALPRVGYVVVLGSSYSPDGSIPVTSALDGAGLARVVEAVRLLRRLDGAKLVVSGGARSGGTPSAAGYALLARDLGVASDSIVVRDTALDTGGEARDIVALLGAEPFLLVTSAVHMPRAMALMKRAGARPSAAPADHRAHASLTLGWQDGVPRLNALRATEEAVHEYLGLAALSFGID